MNSDSSDDRKGPSKASVPIFEGPSVQGLLDHYGYNDIEEYLSWNYFPSTDKDITEKDITDEDCIHESNYAMSKGYLASICKLAFAACICTQAFASKHLQLAFAFAVVACICSFHLQLAFANETIMDKLQVIRKSICNDLIRTNAFASNHLQAKDLLGALWKRSMLVVPVMIVTEEAGDARKKYLNF
ncbi:hypothetical protein Tco_0782852 [Tanacetum coccineum]